MTLGREDPERSEPLAPIMKFPTRILYKQIRKNKYKKLPVTDATNITREIMKLRFISTKHCLLVRHNYNQNYCPILC